MKSSSNDANQSHQTPALYSPLSCKAQRDLSAASLSRLSSHFLHSQLWAGHTCFYFSSSGPICSSLRAFATAVSLTCSAPPPNGCFLFNIQVSGPLSSSEISPLIMSQPLHPILFRSLHLSLPKTLWYFVSYLPWICSDQTTAPPFKYKSMIFRMVSLHSRASNM